MKSRRRDTDFHREYPSAWQRHRSNACGLDCHYCVQARRFRDVSWRFIPSERYAGYVDQQRRAALAERQKRDVIQAGQRRIITPDQHRMVQAAKRSG